MDLFDNKNIILESNLDGKGMQNDESQNPFLAKAKEAFCLIKYKDKSGTGFFYDISGVTFLITNNHVYPQKYELTEKSLDITINGKPITINLEDGRGKWTNSEMDFTCIEIKKEDNIKTPISLCDNILKSNYSNKDYLNKNVTTYALNNNDMYKLYYSYGYIKESDDYLFAHTCNTYPGCSGGCIVIQNNNSVIGIRKGGHKNGKVNIGIFINDVIEDIKNQVNHSSYNLL